MSFPLSFPSSLYYPSLDASMFSVADKSTFVTQIPEKVEIGFTIYPPPTVEFRTLPSDEQQNYYAVANLHELCSVSESFCCNGSLEGPETEAALQVLRRLQPDLPSGSWERIVERASPSDLNPPVEFYNKALLAEAMAAVARFREMSLEEESKKR